VLAGDSAATIVNGIFWLVLPLLPVALGVLTVRYVSMQKQNKRPIHPLPFLAVFFALVSLHFQVSIYLFYSVGLTIAGLLWFVSAEHQVIRRVAVAAGVGGLCCVGLYFHAGQPITRGEWGILRGDRVELVRADQLDACGLWIEPGDVTRYRYLVDLVNREVSPDQPILALPVNPELYFLTGRPSAARFFNSALGVQNAAQLRQFLQELDRTRPQLVFYQPGNLYGNTYCDQIMRVVRDGYELLETFDGFEIYRRKPNELNLLSLGAVVSTGETR
jgi:hypothetical protein